MTSDDYEAALGYAEDCEKFALTPFDRNQAVELRGISLILLKRAADGTAILGGFRKECTAQSWQYHFAGTDAAWGVSIVLNGRIRTGIRFIDRAIAQREGEGQFTVADWYRMILADVYLQILMGTEKPPLATLISNLPYLIFVRFVAARRIRRLLARVRQNTHIDAAGFHHARINMILGLVCKVEGRVGAAREHLVKAHTIAVRFGNSPMLAKIEAALAQLCHA